MATTLPLKSCNTCHGIYAPVQPDGTAYYHACPPLSDDEVIAALKLPVDRAEWPPADQAAFAAFDRTRPNARDENIVLPLKPGDPVRIKAAGAGTTDVA